MAEQNSGLFWKDDKEYAQGLAPELSQAEKALRDLFVDEYLKDFDRVGAALRCGFNIGFAKQYSDQFWAEPYTQQRLAEMQRTKSQVDPELEKEKHKAIVLNSLLQAVQNGPYASRVSAARELANIYGWNKPQADDSEENKMIQMLKEFAAKAPV